jgi:hypothetical protein
MGDMDSQGDGLHSSRDINIELSKMNAGEEFTEAGCGAERSGVLDLSD